MSQFYEYKWPVPSEDGLALSQALTANTPLKLNGLYADKTIGTVHFNDFGIVPKITLTSISNLATTTFLISGYQNGIFISESLIGPNNTTVTSVNCFDTVEQIIPDNTSNDLISVGVGSTGYFPIILLNTALTNASGINYALNMITEEFNPPSYQVFLSLKNYLGVGKYDDLTDVANHGFVSTAAPASTSALIQYNSLASNLLIKITANYNGTTLKTQFLQL
jgi:hypothetical protein